MKTLEAEHKAKMLEISDFLITNNFFEEPLASRLKPFIEELVAIYEAEAGNNLSVPSSYTATEFLQILQDKILYSGQQEDKFTISKALELFYNLFAMIEHEAMKKIIQQLNDLMAYRGSIQTDITKLKNILDRLEAISRPSSPIERDVSALYASLLRQTLNEIKE